MKKYVKILAVLSVVLLLGLAGMAIYHQMTDYSSTLHSNWDISLPKAAHITEVYSKETKASFHGDGCRYHIFACRHAEAVDRMFTWSPAEQKTHFNASYREAAMQWLSEIGVPQAQYPNFDSCVWWYATKKDHSEILFCWDSNANRLYIIEQFL